MARSSAEKIHPTIRTHFGDFENGATRRKWTGLSVDKAICLHQATERVGMVRLSPTRSVVIELLIDLQHR